MQWIPTAEIIKNHNLSGNYVEILAPDTPLENIHNIFCICPKNLNFLL